MKKVLKKVLVLAIGATMVFTACKKDDEKPTAIASGAGTGTATIQGKITALLDETNSNPTSSEAPLNNVQIKFTYDAAELDVKGNASSEMVIVTATTNSNGEYSISVPTSTSGVNYEVIDGVDFIVKVKVNDTNSNGDPITPEKDFIFTLDNTSDRTLVNGDVWILDITASKGAEKQ